MAAVVVGMSFADELTIGDNEIVKTGSGTSEVTAAQVGARSVRVEGGVLRIVQTSATRARYVRFKVRERNPWRTQNANGTTEMQSFQLVNGENLVAYPEGTTATDLGVNTKTTLLAQNVLTYGRVQANEWCTDESTTPGFTIDMQETVEFNGYTLGTAWNSPGRMPYSFTVEVGVDDGHGGIDWALFDDRAQYCSSSYGKDWFGTGSSYSPRMAPVYAANPLPVFAARATVSVVSGATLELDGVSGRLPNLSGSGLVKLTSARPSLTGNCSFTGSFDGVGILTFAMDDDVVSPFTFATTGLRVENAGKARSFIVSGGATAAKLPIIYDSAEAPLDLTVSGKVETPKLPKRVDRFQNDVAFVRNGRTMYADADVTLLDATPVQMKYLRYFPISGAGTPSVIQVQEIKFFSDSTLLMPTDVQLAWADAFATTNYTTSALSDQSALIISTTQPNAAKLFDADTTTYYQYNQTSASGMGGGLKNCPGITVTFEAMKGFDTFEFWQPTSDICSNVGYWPGMWRIETSVDGNVWEALDDQSESKVDVSRLYTGWPPVVTTPVSSGAMPRETAWFSADGYALTEDMSISGELKYLRLFLRELSSSYETTNGSSYVDIAELEVHKSGSKVTWPSGTIAYCTDGAKTSVPGLINAPEAMPWDDNNSTHINENAAVDGSSDMANRAIWNVGYEKLSQGAGFIVEMPQAIAFDQYKIYAGYNWDGNYRIPSKWTFDVSYDGENWTTIDSADREGGFDVPSVWAISQFFVKRSVDFSDVGRMESDSFADGNLLKIHAGATLSLSNANETVGGITGEGGVSLTDADLTVKDGDSLFSGTISGASGTLVVDGGTLTMNKANLKGLSKIILKNGATLKGNAVYRNSLAVEVEAGCVNALYKTSGFTISIR